MNWLLVFWEDRRARLTEEGRQMLTSAVRLPRASAWVERGGVELETPAEKLQPGDVVAVRGSEIIPADGRILSGNAVLGVYAPAGINRLVCLGVGDEVHEGSCVVEGDVRIEVLRSGEQTVATTISRTLSAAAALPADGKSPPALEFAERAVPPVLMMASAGFLVGDAAVAAAVLRPDYATGPGIGGSLTLIDLLRACYEEGIVVRRPDAFQKIAAANLFLFDHDRLLVARLVQLEDLHVAGDWSANEILESAACGMRRLSDPRARVVIAANAFQGGIGRQVPVTYRSGGLEFRLCGRSVRIEGVGRMDAKGLAPLTVYFDGALAGSMSFCHRSAAAAAQAIHELRTQCGVQVGLISSAPAADANRFAAELGVDEVHLCPTDDSKVALIQQLRADKRSVVFVGDCRANPAAAKAANVAICPSPDPSPADDGSRTSGCCSRNSKNSSNCGRWPQGCAVRRAFRSGSDFASKPRLHRGRISFRIHESRCGHSFESGDVYSVLPQSGHFAPRRGPAARSSPPHAERFGNGAAEICPSSTLREAAIG